VVAAEGHALAAKEVICAVAGRSCAWFKSLSSDQVGAPTGGRRATTARGARGAREPAPTVFFRRCISTSKLRTRGATRLCWRCGRRVRSRGRLIARRVYGTAPRVWRRRLRRGAERSHVYKLMLVDAVRASLSSRAIS